jgi:hypothetical protein
VIALAWPVVAVLFLALVYVAGKEAFTFLRERAVAAGVTAAHREELAELKALVKDLTGRVMAENNAKTFSGTTRRL